MINLKRWLATPTSNRSSRGQSLVEFALTLPILLLILVGVLDLGRLYFTYISLTNAAREGARYGAKYPPTNPTDQANSRVQAINNHVAGEVDRNIVTLTASNITINCPDGVPCTPGSPNTPGINNRIQVTVTYPFQLITTYIFGGGTLQLRSSAEMVIYNNP